MLAPATGLGGLTLASFGQRAFESSPGTSIRRLCVVQVLPWNRAASFLTLCYLLQRVSKSGQNLLRSWCRCRLRLQIMRNFVGLSKGSFAPS